MARLQHWAQVGLARLVVGEDLPALGGGQRVDLPFELLPDRRHRCVPDLDLGADEQFGDEEFGMAGRLREVSELISTCC
jgi:hypothetical protein